MLVAVIIPARFASSRYPGKPLEMLSGATGLRKTLIQRSWEAAEKADGVDRVIVATDDIRIREQVETFGGECLMTSSACSNGTERCAEALDFLGDYYDIIINVQGDAPLTPHWFVNDLIAALGSAPEFRVATPVIRCSGAVLSEFKNDRRKGLVGGTTAVFDAEGKALYFSKEVIPWVREEYFADEETPIFHHVGVYAYTPEALRFYASLGPGFLERSEGLEQLRFLEYGEPMLCVEVDGGGRVFWEVNNPSDVPTVEAGLKAAGIE